MSKPYHASSKASKRREVYEVDEIRRLIRACPNTPTGARDRFAIMLLWCTGLKTSELLSVCPRHLFFGVVKAGRREVVIPGGQRERLQELREAWEEHRQPIATARSPLICNLSGRPLDSSYVRHMLADLSEAADLGKRLSAQGFRNTFAAAMHYGGVPMEIIRRQLGLSDIEYTAGYIALVAPSGQHDAMGSFSLE